MPNHFHLVLWPRKNQGPIVSTFMKWLQQTHTQRWHAHYRNAGEGRLYQGRFKAFPIHASWNDFAYLRKVCRYVERNALRAKLAARAEDWPHGSLHRRLNPQTDGEPFLADWPKGAYPGDGKWTELVNRALPGAEEKALTTSLTRGSPFGPKPWQTTTAKSLHLEHTLRPPGRPKKAQENNV